MNELLREYWDWFLFDTLVWTGALIALVMLVRRPVAKHFGPGAAYALWFVPFARLVLPPLVLPAWMAPRSSESISFDRAPMIHPEEASAPSTYFADMAGSAPAPATFPDPTDLVLPLVALWLLGALVMLVRRFWLYFELRRDLLADARPVGEVGRIRLVETSVISGPMAFGVLDRVIALPAGFMASRDRMSRDLAIAHELAHHRGGDLIVNMAVQPLFAIHWFNPLGWFGWNAMRRDQEAACDARVVAACSREERATYAGIIADFARHPEAAPRPALAAPMACPVLGDKSIIHRLRSLTMSDISPRRRFAGRATLAGAFLAVPLTASICYAEVAAAPKAPAAPDAPVAAMAPLAPAPPAPPEAPDVEQGEGQWEMQEGVAEAEAELHEAEMAMEEARVELARAREAVRVRAREGKHRHSEARAETRAYADGRRQWAEGRVQWAEGRREWAEGRKEWAEGRRDWDQTQMEKAIEEGVAASVAMALRSVPEVIEKCVDPVQPVSTVVQANGKTVMFVCEEAGDRLALSAIQSARKAIAADRSLDSETRAEILRDLDEEIAELRRN